MTCSDLIWFLISSSRCEASSAASGCQGHLQLLLRSLYFLEMLELSYQSGPAEVQMYLMVLE
jgi:hypothetical protein